MESEYSLPCPQEPATCSYPSQMNSAHRATSVISVLILSYHLSKSIPSGLFISGFSSTFRCQRVSVVGVVVVVVVVYFVIDSVRKLLNTPSYV